MSVAEVLIKWYSVNKRPLPWRGTNDPYKIWVSEIILQQTRIEQGLPYYLRFVEQYPDLGSLAVADEDTVLNLWKGLGYYSRARNMLCAARQIMADHKGVFPQNPEDIRALKGVGEYTAAAILSFAFNKPFPVIDGNVNRFVARYTGIVHDPGSAEGKKSIRNHLNLIFDRNQPADFNQAIMEFGALQCRPVNPDCSVCPLKDGCFAFLNNKVEGLPARNKKVKVNQRYITYYVIYHPVQGQNHVYLHKRGQHDIWRGLYDFPDTTAESEADSEHLKNNILNQVPPEIAEIETKAIKVRHQLTHLTLYVSFQKIILDGAYNADPLLEMLFPEMKLHRTSVSDLSQIPHSGLISRYFVMEP